MNDKKIRDGINAYIGKEKMLTPHLRNKLLSNLEVNSRRRNYMNFFKPVLSIAVLLVVFGGTTYFLLTKDEANKQSASENSSLIEQLSQLEKENRDLKYNLENMTTQNSVLKEEIQSLNENKDDSIHNVLNLGSKMELERLGFEGKTEDIVAELLKHPEIIPYDGTLGGTMHFYEDEIKVISHEWIFAPFSDGHYGGSLLIKYKIVDGKPTGWEIVDSFLY